MVYPMRWWPLVSTFLFHINVKPTQTKQVKDEGPTEIERRPRRGWRRFRLWEKKRGCHQTGSTLWGGTGETLFFAALFLVGIATLTQLVWLRIASANQSYLTSNVGLLLSVLLLGSFIVIGAAGAIYSVICTATSAERRAAIAKSAVDHELLAEVQKQAEHKLPTIPDDTNWKNSPGVRLAYRLPSATSSSWRLLVVASFCLIWNGAVAVLAVLAFHRSESSATWNPFDPGAWTLFRMVVLFYGFIGILAIRRLLEMLFRAAKIGPTSLEVSSLPLHPGSQYRVHLSQAGHFNIESLEVSLVCDEEVSFSDGTDTRLESRRVYDDCVFRHQDFEVEPSKPFECDCPLDIPQDAMHSFVAENNAVTWKLVVQVQPKVDKNRTPFGKLSRRIRSKARRFLKLGRQDWPAIERVYPLVLHPTS